MTANARIKKAREIVQAWAANTSKNYVLEAADVFVLQGLITQALPEMPTGPEIYNASEEESTNRGIAYQNGFLHGIRWLAERLGLEEPAACTETHE